MHFKLEPSRLAYYFENGCPGYLLSENTLGLASSNSSGVIDSLVTVSDAEYEGRLWQDEVLTKISEAGIPVISNLVIKSADELYEAISTAFKENEGKSYIYLDDCIFDLPLTIKEVNGNVAFWSRFIPDLIHVQRVSDGKYLLTIGDIKSSKKLRVEHKMQVAIYEYILSGWLDGNENLTINPDEGFIYLSHTRASDLQISEDGIVGKRFSLQAPLGFLGEFIDSNLDKILEGINAEDGELSCYNQYLFANCNNCPKKAICHAKAKDNYDIRLFPYMSNLAQKYWIDKGLPVSLLDKNGVVNRDRFIDICKSEREYLLANSFWKEFMLDEESMRNRKVDLFTLAFDDSYWTGMPWTIGNMSNISNGDNCTLAIPKTNDVAVYIHADIRRAMGGDRYLGGYSIKTVINNRNDINPSHSQVNHECVFDDTGDKSELFVLDFFNTINTFYTIAADENIDDFKLKIYVFDEIENSFIYKILFNALSGSNAILANFAKDVLSYLQSEQFIVAEIDHPGNTISYPMTTVLGVVKDLYIIPAFTSYDADSILRAMGVFVPDGTSAVDKLELIVTRIQELDSDRLYGVVEPFAKPAVNNISDPLLSKLHYLVLNEIQIERQSNSKYLMWDDTKLFRNGLAIILNKVPGEAKKYQLDMTNFAYEQNVVPDTDDYYIVKGRWVLIDHSARNFKNSFDKLRSCYLSGERLIGANLAVRQDLTTEISDTANCYTASGPVERYRISSGLDSIMAVKIGDISSTYRTALDSIRRLDEVYRNNTDYRWYPDYCETDVPDNISNYSTLFADETQQSITDFTESQLETFVKFLSSNMTLLQGPPGTGKTDFIARALIAISRLHKIKMDSDPSIKPLTVAISANSHAAINNVLAKINAYQEVNDVPLELYKCQRMAPENVALIGDYSERELINKWVDIKTSTSSETAMYVFGSTNWFIDKVSGRLRIPDEPDGPTGFDYILVDEASQMSCYQAISLFHNASPNTKYLVVGDPLQLSSIIKGEYSYENDDDICVSSSVYDFFNSLPDAECYKKMIREDFRMNRVILDYVKSLYAGYAPVNCDVSDRRLDPVTVNYDCPDNLRALMDLMLDPDKPFVACYVSGGNAKEQKQAEIDLSYEITRVLYQVFGNALADNYGVIIPHHVHINDVTKRINSIYTDAGEENNLIINTVDKLQGQEKDIVLSTYGVSDMEQILREVDFIYSLNRLNVALSRARKKSVILMSDTLARRPIESLAYDDDGARMRGINFLCGLKDYATSKCSSPVIITLASGVAVKCYGVGFGDID